MSSPCESPTHCPRKILRPGLSPVCRRRGPQQLGSVHGAMGHASQLSLLTPSTPGLVTLDAQGVSRWRPIPGGRHRFLSSGRRAGGNRREYEKNLTAFDLKRQPGSGMDRRAYAGCSLFHFSYSAAMTLSMGARPSSTSCTSASADTRASISTAEVSVPINS